MCLAIAAVLPCLLAAVALAQPEGEWTGRGWVGPRESDGGIFGFSLIVAVLFGLGYLINEGFPNVLPTFGGIVIMFVVSELILWVLIAMGANLHENDVLWIFSVWLMLGWLHSISKRKKTRK